MICESAADKPGPSHNIMASPAKPQSMQAKPPSGAVRLHPERLKESLAPLAASLPAAHEARSQPAGAMANSSEAELSGTAAEPAHLTAAKLSIDAEPGSAAVSKARHSAPTAEALARPAAPVQPASKPDARPVQLGRMAVQPDPDKQPYVPEGLTNSPCCPQSPPSKPIRPPMLSSPQWWVSSPHVSCKCHA